MESIVQGDTCIVSSATDAGTAGVAGTMHGAIEVDLLTGLANVFHDVDFARARPEVAGNITAEHPEGRPDALPVRDLDARFGAPIGKVKFIFS